MQLARPAVKLARADSRQGAMASLDRAPPVPVLQKQAGATAALPVNGSAIGTTI